MSQQPPGDGTRQRHSRDTGRISLDRFRQLVAEALDSLPAPILALLTNVPVVVENEPDDATLRDLGLDPGRDTPFGLYVGVPIDQRFGQEPALPDRIVIYYLPLTDEFGDDYHLRREIRKTVVHEVGHHFGLDDRQMRRMGY